MNIEKFVHHVQVHVQVDVKPSESPVKVAQAVKELLPLIFDTLRSEAGLIVGIVEGIEALEVIHKQLRARRTRSVARRLLNRNRSGDTSWLLFNKQAAFCGVASLCEEEEDSPLGPVKVTISSSGLSQLIDWLAPQL